MAKFLSSAGGDRGRPCGYYDKKPRRVSSRRPVLSAEGKPPVVPIRLYIVPWTVNFPTTLADGRTTHASRLTADRRHGPGRRRRPDRLPRPDPCRPTEAACQGRRSCVSGPRAAAPASETSVQLPIGQVVLFSSGVGYFQREGQVEGDARVDLSFPVQDINDLIKSMVLRDLDGGHIAAVSYDSNAPVEKTLQSFAVNLSANPTFGQILNQARGEKVEVVLQQANAAQPGTMTGSIMGVEQKQEAADKAVVNVEQLNMWCADGMRSVKLSELQRVRFLNPIMDNEVRKALETLTLSHDTQKKAVCLNFVGEGKRNVRVGYVIENPIWKTSYRLVLGKEKEDKPFLQGWAVVENATDEDWKDVRMALVSGRPISFQMDLYTPLYVPRPTVVPGAVRLAATRHL